MCEDFGGVNIIIGDVLIDLLALLLLLLTCHDMRHGVLDMSPASDSSLYGEVGGGRASSWSRCVLLSC